MTVGVGPPLLETWRAHHSLLQGSIVYTWEGCQAGHTCTSVCALDTHWHGRLVAATRQRHRSGVTLIGQIAAPAAGCGSLQRGIQITDPAS